MLFRIPGWHKEISKINKGGLIVFVVRRQGRAMAGQFENAGSKSCLLTTRAGCIERCHFHGLNHACLAALWYKTQVSFTWSWAASHPLLAANFQLCSALLARKSTSPLPQTACWHVAAGPCLELPCVQASLFSWVSSHSHSQAVVKNLCSGSNEYEAAAGGLE